MRLIKPSVEFIDEVNREEALLKIANAAKTCYKSGVLGENEIEKASNMVKRLVESNHAAMLEHYSVSVRVVCDRGVSHELCRHRIMSFAQESQRFIKYGLCGKEADDITFIIPSWANIEEGVYSTAIFHNEGGDEEVIVFCEKKNIDLPTNETMFLRGLDQCEKIYNFLMKNDMQAQQARGVLPNATKTEIVMTANLREWKHFCDLRSKGTTGKPHPDMKIIADMIYNEFHEKLPEIFN